jgi:hypothetical protein
LVLALVDEDEEEDEVVVVVQVKVEDDAITIHYEESVSWRAPECMREEE